MVSGVPALSRHHLRSVHLLLLVAVEVNQDLARLAKVTVSVLAAAQVVVVRDLDVVEALHDRARQVLWLAVRIVLARVDRQVLVVVYQRFLLA